MPFRSALTSLSSGEFSPQLSGRLDLQRFHSSAQRILNAIVKPFGGASRVPGSHFAAALKNEDREGVAISFVYNARESYLLVFEGGRMEGDEEVGGTMRVMSGHGYVLNAEETGPYEIETPYTESDLRTLRKLQHRDVMYLTTGTKPVHKLIRKGHQEWEIGPCSFKNGPFMEKNKAKEHYISFSSGSGLIDISASFDMFSASDVGRVLKINDGSVLITEYTDARNVKGSVDATISDEANIDSYGEELLSGAWTVDSGTLAENTASKIRGTGAFVVSETVSLKYERKYFMCFDVAMTEGSFTIKIENTKHTLDVLCNSVFTDAGLLYITVDMGEYLGGTLPYDSGSNSYPPDPDKTDVKITVTRNGSAEATFSQITLRQMEPEHPKATFHWAWEAFSEENGYPRAMCIENRRLYLASTKTSPNAIWASKSDGEREDFYSWDTELDTTGLHILLESGEMEEIRWLEPKDGRIYCGTDVGLWRVEAKDGNKAIAPSNVQALKTATYGSTTLDALIIGDGIIYMERAGETIREYAYNVQTDAWEPNNLSIWGEHLLRASPVKAYAWQQQPFGVLWLVRRDGVLVSMTYLKKENVLAFSSTEMEGAAIESLATIINESGKEELWLLVRRTIDGQVRRYIEYIEAEYDDQKDWFYVHSGLVYDGEIPVDEVGGLDHLVGETVKVVGDGFVLEDQVVSEAGRVQLIGPGGPYPAKKVIVGKGYTTLVTTQPLEQARPDGTLQTLSVHIAKVFLRLYRSGDGTSVWKDLNDEFTRQEILIRQPDVPMDDPTPPFTGLAEAYVVSGYDMDTTLTVMHDQPTAFNLVGLIAEWEGGN